MELSFDEAQHQAGLSHRRLPQQHQLKLADFVARRCGVGPRRSASPRHGGENGGRGERGGGEVGEKKLGEEGGRLVGGAGGDQADGRAVGGGGGGGGDHTWKTQHIV